ncbi:Ferritin-like domain-containing protein [Abditibacterium utsteinense]|uniref:Ferritin-like domain-containing protein n=1 Tax=Abditibacterium utsteinense TaxID=1960156 RepID=A0A2S8SSN7_9BACT|nr:ferritin-like domain-containing protein [Abditibacterium utsteinense]PQV63805.1 Ferritin-like domain-containing protein [Abditibacterium utsteinense]
MNEFEKIQRDPVSRRAFLQRMGAAGLGVAAVSMLQGCGGGSSNNSGGNTSRFPITVPGKNDNIKILNYALTLEILEADLYRQALNLATGRALTANLEANPSAYQPDAGVSNLGTFNAAGFAYLRDFAYVEAAHRDFLDTTIRSLNDTPVARNPKGYTFGTAPAKNLRAILQAILPLEETGVRAYLGASAYFVDFPRSANLVQAAVGIYSTEARHSAAIQYILGNDIGPNGNQAGVPSNTKLNGLPYSDKGLGDTFEYFSTPQQVIQAVSPFFVK